MNKEIKTHNQAIRLIVKCLRHDPKILNINIDDEGYADVSTLLNNLNIKFNYFLNVNELEESIKNNERLNIKDGKIRAEYGHSINVTVDLLNVKPPTFLYHGTNENVIDIILQEGLKSMSRTKVHLTKSKDLAYEVGKRKKGKTKILKIKAGEMQAMGYVFEYVDDKHFLVKEVPAKYLEESKND